MFSFVFEMPRQKDQNLKPISLKKELSGGTKRKLKEQEDAEARRLAAVAAKFFKPAPSTFLTGMGLPPSFAGDCLKQDKLKFGSKICCDCDAESAPVAAETSIASSSSLATSQDLTSPVDRTASDSSSSSPACDPDSIDAVRSELAVEAKDAKAKIDSIATSQPGGCKGMF